MALLALSHTWIEHQLYCVMHAETVAARKQLGTFGVRRLLSLSGLRSHGSVRRGCSGLISKLSVENVSDGGSRLEAVYRVFSPDEIFTRRRAAGLAPYPEELRAYECNQAFYQAIEHVVRRNDISRREALVILCCAEGLSNAEIGQRLRISEQTVKFHLRHIFDKFGVKRRTELVSRLLTQKFGAGRQEYLTSGTNGNARGHRGRVAS